MIIICEPQCKSFSHEKVNSGFLYLASLTYPEDEIVFFAHKSHINSIKSILKHDNIVIPKILYIPISFYTSFSRIGLFQFNFLFKRIFNYCIKNNVEKILFLSFSAPLLATIKNLKHKLIYKNFKFSFILHGDFENIADEIKIDKIESFKLNKIDLKIDKFNFIVFTKKIILTCNTIYLGIQDFYKKKFSIKFPIKNILIQGHTKDYRYIALAPYIVKNAEKYQNINLLNIYNVFFPTNYANYREKSINTYPKFAVFGYGNNIILREILDNLLLRKGLQKFEIKIIGMDISGMFKYEMVSCPSKGKPLTRDIMEQHVTDIDFFLILYNKNKYRLSCSGSIIESLSYMKPIIHLENECINYFNTKELPIGISCNNIEEYISVLEDIINNFQNYNNKIDVFTKNILYYRNKLRIQNSLDDFKNSYEWD